MTDSDTVETFNLFPDLYFPSTSSLLDDCFEVFLKMECLLFNIQHFHYVFFCFPDKFLNRKHILFHNVEERLLEYNK